VLRRPARAKVHCGACDSSAIAALAETASPPSTYRLLHRHFGAAHHV